MNFIRELQSLDFNEPGRWPVSIRVFFIALVFVGVTAFGIYMWVVNTDHPELARVEQIEIDLRASFEQKQRRAANFDAYRNQLAQIERDFGTMLRQLPGETEVPSLLEDISQTGLAAGLQEDLFQPSAEVRRDFYAELPIRIRLRGSYHEFGEFVSGIAKLPRIVTLHDIQITPVGQEGEDRLTLDLTAKTYRYLDEGTTGG
jgi:type IV pilus assembly protein PilO